MRRAKILATLGPSSATQEQIEAVIKAGANAVRINMSHGDVDSHTELISNARAASNALREPLSILVDLSGPKIRTRALEDKGPVLLENGAEFVITTRDIVGSKSEVATNFDKLPSVVTVGGKIMLDDGSLELRGQRKDRDGCSLRSRRRWAFV